MPSSSGCPDRLSLAAISGHSSFILVHGLDILAEYVVVGRSVFSVMVGNGPTLAGVALNPAGANSVTDKLAAPATGRVTAVLALTAGGKPVLVKFVVPAK